MNRTSYILLSVAICGALYACSNCPDAQTLYEQGKALREEGKLVEAMQCFIDATHSGTRDDRLLGRIYSNMANMCRQANEHETALEVYALSANHFAASGDTLAYAYALNNMAWEQAVMGHKDSALTLVNSAVAICPYPPLTDKVRESRAAACLFAQEYDSVLFWSAPPANDYLLTLRAQAYSYLQIDDSATCYAQLLLPRTTNIFALDDIYYILTHNDVTAGKETLRALASQRADVQKTIESRHGKLTQAVQLLKQDLNRGNKPWQKWGGRIAAMLGVVLSLIALGLFGRWRYERSTHTHIRKEELDSILRTLREAENIRKELAWGDYAECCRRMDKLMYGLAYKLQSQGLNEQDVRLCLLVLVGLSHKQIAEILNCSPKSIGKLKDLTARKLGVSGGQLQSKIEQLIIV